MGLDQYGYTTETITQADYEVRLAEFDAMSPDEKWEKNLPVPMLDPEGNPHLKTEISYWRKHNRLQGYMSDLWIEKGRPNKYFTEDGQPMDDYFNCLPLELTDSDLKYMEKIVKDLNLPETNGFFFGSDSYNYLKEDRLLESDLEFIQQGRIALKQGKKVYYSCWW